MNIKTVSLLMKKIVATIVMIFIFQGDISAQCWTDISAAGNSTFFIDQNKRLFACGSNSSGQLGIGHTPFSTDTLIQVSFGTKWVDISAGVFHALGIQEDGSLWTWGNNRFGQLGIGNNVSQVLPIQVGNDNDWLEVNTGYHSSVALKEDGTLWAWGQNTLYQLGLGHTDSQLIPAQVGNDNDWVSFSTGNVHTLAIKADGTLWAWGNNFNGQIGDGTTNESPVPTMISSDIDWRKVSTEGLHTMALKEDGSLWVWGNNSRGQLGVDTIVSSLKSPIQIMKPNKWTDIFSSESNSAGIDSSGILWVWGSNEFGQLGFSSNESNLVPIEFIDSLDWKYISMGLFHMIGLKNGGHSYSWGRNDIGQLGTGNTMNTEIPVQVPCSFLTQSKNVSQDFDLMIYPNPFVSDLNIFSKKKQLLHLYNYQGQKVNVIRLKKGNNQFNMTHTSKGVFFLKNEVGHISKLKKITN